jgi:MOSC domain-containing protein YiiM
MRRGSRTSISFPRTAQEVRSMPEVRAVCRAGDHTFSKHPVDAVTLVEGLGVHGDAHAGATVRHRSRVLRDPTRPNLRQVHLIHAELHEELREAGHDVGPGAMGENITTWGIALLGLGTGTRLALGTEAIVVVTGLRNPCTQLDDYSPGLMRAVLDRDADGAVVRRAGIMAVVERSGVVRPGDGIGVEPPPSGHQPLKPV